jgi:hypothetical protein
MHFNGTFRYCLRNRHLLLRYDLGHSTQL